MHVVVLAPHPDDESIGCGGAIALHTRRADRVTVVFLTSGERGLAHLPCKLAQETRETEALAAAEVLGISQCHFLRHPDSQLAGASAEAARALEKIIRWEQPSRVYLPHPRESHPDHSVCYKILADALEACRPAEVFGYEIWTPIARCDTALDITTTMRDKLRAIRCHTSQLSDLHYDRAVEGLNRYRGAFACRSEYAEVFVKLRITSAYALCRSDTAGAPF